MARQNDVKALLALVENLYRMEEEEQQNVLNNIVADAPAPVPVNAPIPPNNEQGAGAIIQAVRDPNAGFVNELGYESPEHRERERAIVFERGIYEKACRMTAYERYLLKKCCPGGDYERLSDEFCLHEILPDLVERDSEFIVTMEDDQRRYYERALAAGFSSQLPFKVLLHLGYFSPGYFHSCPRCTLTLRAGVYYDILYCYDHLFCGFACKLTDIKDPIQRTFRDVERERESDA